MSKEQNGLSRRHFISSVAATGALMVACSSGGGKYNPNKISGLTPPDQAPDGPVLKAGVIGCGGRGTGAAINFLNAGPNLQVVALTDTFKDRVDSCREKLKTEKNVEIADEMCFVGLDGYQKVIDAGVDVVLIATPPYFRPEQFAAAVNARKHVFMEKPIAVDPVGARSIMATAKKAESLGLTVVTGTQRRHQKNYQTTFEHIKSGAIGDIVGANVYWNQSQLWYRTRQPGWSELEWMIRDWVNWTWLSGDHIVEQHVHNIDVLNWFTGTHPVKAVGFGGRHRRVTGDQYDFFSVDYVFENGMHAHSMCRQINGCINNVSEFIMGTKGHSNCANKIWAPDGSVLWEYPEKKNEQGEVIKDKSPYDQEHVDMITAIRGNQPFNEAENTAISTLVAIMGRISAYTGKEVTWEEVMNSDMKIGPDTMAWDKTKAIASIAVPGSENK